jgi:hypothetical protein
MRREEKSQTKQDIVFVCPGLVACFAHIKASSLLMHGLIPGIRLPASLHDKTAAMFMLNTL